jgi:glycine hydroxymethyltransferase
MARAQDRWRLHESINLLPSENITSPQLRALLSSDFGHRYTLPVNGNFAGEFIENSYRGARLSSEVEESAEKLAREVFRSKHACVQPLSGHIAAMIVIASTAPRGEMVCSISPENGGYDGYAQSYVPDLLGLSACSLPFDPKAHNLDVAATCRLIRDKEPRLVVLGASFILFPYEMKPIVEACSSAGSTLVYDGSHVLGLIAGGEFQKPLRQGADALYGSTHKSFFGPQGGLIVTDDDGIDRAIRKNLTWRIVDNVHWNRVAALGQALLEAKKFGPSYARQVVRNSKRLGKELDERGFPIRFEELGYTESHQLLIDSKKVRRKFGISFNDFSVRMEMSNIIIDSVARLGTAEMTRLGMKERDVPELADLFVEAAGGKEIKKKVAGFRRKFDLAFTY